MKAWKPIRKDGKRECPECTNSYRADSRGEFATVAHFESSQFPHVKGE